MQNKNLKLSLCGLALTSFLALNTHSIVHADTVQNGNANNNAITWDSDNDDSQVVKSEPQQAKASPTVQKQAPVQSNVQASQSQLVQNKKVMVSNVSSAPSSQQRAETSVVRQSNFETSTVNRLNANKNQAIKVSSVQDVSQAPIQKQKVAQFNQGSKIYTLNGTNQLSKNNGDGYVITNAGKYNGRAVDIGVTINNVQDNQGTYTTKWSNGDKADVTGKTDANFKYQDSVLLNQQQIAPQVDQSRTRTRNETKQVPYKYTFRLRHDGASDWGIEDEFDDDITESFLYYYTLIFNNETGDDRYFDAFAKAAIDDILGHHYSVDSTNLYDTLVELMDNETPSYDETQGTYQDPSTYRLATTSGATFEDRLNNILADTAQGDASTFARASATGGGNDGDHIAYFELAVGHGTDAHKISESVPVTDHLQLASSTPASLGYNYTVGLYDAQTGDLITDLKAEYNSKAGVQATAKDSVMNNVIKSKIQQINQNKAQVSYTGTRANDDVAFYQETRAVNPQDQSLHKSATRIISVNLPNDAAAKARYKGILDANDQVVQTINFTRTGVENVVTGHVTYGAWQGPSSFGAVTLPDIPGYTMSLS